MELIVYYILPNIALFGSLWAVAKLVEHGTWYVICNYENITKMLDNRFSNK